VTQGVAGAILFHLPFDRMPTMLLNPNAVILFALVLYAGLYLLAI
jgi:hypothetical protein